MLEIAFTSKQVLNILLMAAQTYEQQTIYDIRQPHFTFTLILKEYLVS